MKSVLNYFVRKAFGFKSTAKPTDKTLYGSLLRIRQNIQGVYDWLYGRLSAEHLPKRMPMTEAVTDPNDGHEVRRPVAQNSDNLLAHLALLNGRKISNGYADGTPAADGLPDGVSLARLLCDSTLQPTELVDDKVGWVCDTEDCLLSAMRRSNALEKVTLNCVEITKCLFRVASYIEMINHSLVMHFPCCKKIANTGLFYTGYNALGTSNNLAYSEVHLDALEECNTTGNSHGVFKVAKLYMPNLKRGTYRFGGTASYENPITTYLYVGCNGKRTDALTIFDYNNGEENNCTDIEISAGARQKITLQGFTKLTAENIALHILDRLADNRYEDDGVTEAPTITITLGATNIATIEADPAYAPYLADAQMKNYTIV